MTLISNDLNFKCLDEDPPAKKRKSEGLASDILDNIIVVKEEKMLAFKRASDEVEVYKQEDSIPPPFDYASGCRYVASGMSTRSYTIRYIMTRWTMLRLNSSGVQFSCFIITVTLLVRR
jgi:hypothetical protein